MHKFLTKNPKQPTILFFIKPEKKNDAKKKSFTDPHLILYKTRKKVKRRKTTLKKNPLQILILFVVKPEKRKTTLRKNPLQIFILFLIKPGTKKNDIKEKFFTNPHHILYKTKKTKRKTTLK